MKLAYRPAEPDDAQFVVSTWSRNYKYSRQAGIIATENWESVFHREAQRLLARPDTRTVIQYEKTDPTFFYGWIAADLEGYWVIDERGQRVFDPSPVIFFCYVKENYRREGFAKGLFSALGVDPRARFLYACWTPILHKIGNAKLRLAVHDPDLARYPKTDRVQERTEERWRP